MFKNLVYLSLVSVLLKNMIEVDHPEFVGEVFGERTREDNPESGLSVSNEDIPQTYNSNYNFIYSDLITANLINPTIEGGHSFHFSLVNNGFNEAHSQKYLGIKEHFYQDSDSNHS